VLDLFEKENLLARANELGDRFQRRAHEWQRRWPIVGDVRGLGGMQAIELVQSHETKVPAVEETKKITQHCYERGLITITAGTYSNVIRVLVPLVASNEQIDEGLDVLESAMAAVCDKKGAGAVAQFV
jgi:4-aminobutyrate aminotransferase/(S)-3-amino-2-methylpropionate transaminase